MLVKKWIRNLIIGKGYQAKIFDMFFCASERSKGSGLGLYIVQETLSKLSGSVKLESEPGASLTLQ